MDGHRMEAKSVVIILVLLLVGTVWAPGDQEIGGNLILTGTGKTLRITVPYVPTSSTAAGTEGDISWDNNFWYVCVADNTWRQTQLYTWGIAAENVTYNGENVEYAGEQVEYP